MADTAREPAAGYVARNTGFGGARAMKEALRCAVDRYITDQLIPEDPYERGCPHREHAAGLPSGEIRRVSLVDII